MISRQLALALLHGPIVLLQVFLGLLIGIGVPAWLALGGGWELVVTPVGTAVGVWLAGLSSLALRGRVGRQEFTSRFLGALTGCFLGIMITLLPSLLPIPFLGWAGALLVALGGVLGFYLLDFLIWRARRRREQSGGRG